MRASALAGPKSEGVILISTFFPSAGMRLGPLLADLESGFCVRADALGRLYTGTYLLLHIRAGRGGCAACADTIWAGAIGYCSILMAGGDGPGGCGNAARHVWRGCGHLGVVLPDHDARIRLARSADDFGKRFYNQICRIAIWDWDAVHRTTNHLNNGNGLWGQR